MEGLRDSKECEDVGALFTWSERVEETGAPLMRVKLPAAKS